MVQGLFFFFLGGRGRGVVSAGPAVSRAPSEQTCRFLGHPSFDHIKTRGVGNTRDPTPSSGPAASRGCRILTFDAPLLVAA
jgi:hypothetical protein